MVKCWFLTEKENAQLNIALQQIECKGIMQSEDWHHVTEVIPCCAARLAAVVLKCQISEFYAYLKAGVIDGAIFAKEFSEQLNKRYNKDEK